MREDDGRKALTNDGTISMMDTTNVYGTLPTRNFRDVQFEGADKIGMGAMKAVNENGHANLVTNSACFGCTIGCGRVCRIDPEHFSVKDKPQYHGASGGLEYETAYALGSRRGGKRHRRRHLLRFPLQRIWYGPHLPGRLHLCGHGII